MGLTSRSYYGEAELWLTERQRSHCGKLARNLLPRGLMKDILGEVSHKGHFATEYLENVSGESSWSLDAAALHI